MVLVICVPDSLKAGSEEFEAFIHHLFCIYGSLACLICGRFIGVVMSASLLTEISTPNVNIWWLLTIHKMSDTKAYAYNAYSLFITFFLCRIVYQFYLIAWLNILGIATIDMSSDSIVMIVYTWISAIIYPWLYFLNIFWFYKMVKGAIEYFSGSGEEEAKAGNEEEKAGLLNDSKEEKELA